MQFKKNDVRKQLLEQMDVSEETIRFLESQNVPFLSEWSYLCAAEGMPAKTLKEICSEAEKDRSGASETFKKERLKYLQESFENNADLGEKFDQLQKKAEAMFQRASSVVTSFEDTVKQSFRDKDKLYGDIIEGRDRILQEKDKQMKALEERITDLKEMEKSKDNRIHALEDRLREAEIKQGPAEKTETSKPDGSAAGDGKTLSNKESDTEKETVIPAVSLQRDSYYSGQIRNRFFLRRKERETERFIREFMENEDFSNEQKEFLIRCLEQGDPMDFIREYASPRLSVEHMAWLRKIAGGRMRYGR